VDSILNIWEAIVKETAAAQETDGQNRGFVKNLVINGIYHRETAFAAKIFAAEYKRTGERKYLEKATMALDALRSLLHDKPVGDGLEEPVLTPRGLDYRKGSIPATILLLESATEAADLISYGFDFRAKEIIEYLKKCYIGNGRFYHDTITGSRKVRSHVVNTTAMAYYFLERYSRQVKDGEFYTSEIKNIKSAIVRSMRSDGFVPYIEPHLFQKVVFSVSRFLPAAFIKVYNRLFLDMSIFFGDGLHHAITIYYYIKGLSLSGKVISNQEFKTIENGWLFIKRNLQEYQLGYIRFDFSWEPKPKGYRHCNFIDTTTYFYVLELLRYLKEYKIIPAQEEKRYLLGLSSHIESRLLRKDALSPCVNPYEGGEAIKSKIIPRPSETVFNKGALLASVIEVARMQD